ncbi:MAG: SHOCT domain-containing protein [Sandarakinorhabdus sp.]|nr:SHOCT domain-containing protein [Sandarakinorhabdus sp.]
MFGNRRGRPSLIGAAARTAGRTAVIVGTANAMSRPRGGPAEQAAPEPVAAAAPAAGGLSAEAIGRLRELAELNQAGILSDAEFAEQKARILNG